MPVARIVSSNIHHPSPALQELSERLHAAGYEVELAPPGTAAAAADLVIELGELPAGEALDAAVRLARDSDCDLFIAPGLLSAGLQVDSPLSSHSPASSHKDAGPRSVAESAIAAVPVANDEPDRGLAKRVEEIGAALAEGGAGIREALAGMRARVSGSWSQFQQRRNDAIRALRLERERREVERDEHRRQHELELRRQAEEKQRLMAERERLAAERERGLREQMAREAAQRAELAHAAEQERRRLTEMETRRLRLIREQEEQYAAVLRAQRLHQQSEAEAERLRQRQMQEATLQAQPLQQEPESDSDAVKPAPPLPARVPEFAAPVFDAVYSDAAPPLRPRPRRAPRRIPSPRERQWQQAALLASVATLAAMIGFAIAANVRPSSPLPAAIIQNGAQQQVPFGPAKMDVSSVEKTPAAAPPLSRPAVVPPLPGARIAGQRGVAHTRATTLEKPSPAKPVTKPRARRSSREADTVADDEVIVRQHLPTVPAQRAQTTAGVRRYSDDD